jgi:hypothetical protein
MDDTAPQIGPYDVDRAALALDGEPLPTVLGRIGVPTDTVPPGTSEDGWRVLADGPSGEGSLLLGAPVDGSRRLWHVAHVSGREPVRISVQPDPQPLRRSVAERRAGLALRWPAITRELLEVDALAVDIVNEGADRWFRTETSSTPRPPSSPSVGRAVPSSSVGRAGRTARSDPGEYMRVHARIDSSQWRDARPGPYLIHAFTPTLRLTTDEPLHIELTPGLIAAHRAESGSAPPSPARERQAAEDRLRILRSYRAARDRLPELVAALRDSHDDREALARIAELLGTADDAAQAVYSLQLRRLRIGARDLLAIEIAELEQHLRDLA